MRSAAWTKPGWTRDTLEERNTQRHEERKKWCRIRAGNEPRIYRSPSGGCGCCCCSRIFLRRASTTGFSYWVFLFIWLAGGTHDTEQVTHGQVGVSVKWIPLYGLWGGWPVRKLTLRNKLRTLGPLFSPILEVNLKLREDINGPCCNTETLSSFLQCVDFRALSAPKVAINLFSAVVASA